MTVRLGEDPRIGEIEVGGNLAACFFTSQTYSCPETVRSMSICLALARAQHCDPIANGGINLRTHQPYALVPTRITTHLLPVCEYTVRVPSCMATAQNVDVAVSARIGDGR